MQSGQQQAACGDQVIQARERLLRGQAGEGPLDLPNALALLLSSVGGWGGFLGQGGWAEGKGSGQSQESTGGGREGDPPMCH